MPLSFPNIGNAAVVGQTSRSARVLQDPLQTGRRERRPPDSPETHCWILGRVHDLETKFGGFLGEPPDL